MTKYMIFFRPINRISVRFQASTVSSFGTQNPKFDTEVSEKHSGWIVRIERVSRFLQNVAIDLPNYMASHPKFHPLRLKMFNHTLVLRQIKQCLLHYLLQAKGWWNFHWVATHICNLSSCCDVHEEIRLLMQLYRSLGLNINLRYYDKDNAI